MQFIATDIPGLIIIEPKVFGDARGFFMETHNERAFRNAGIDVRFVQDNYSRSSRNVLRGLHYQIKQPQGKLVRCVAGSVYDVVLDIRRGSPTFGRWLGFELSAENKRMVWVPPGFAHGFMVTSDTAEFTYKVTDFWAPEHERSVQWNDPALAITWPLGGTQPTLSKKDAEGIPLAQAQVFE